MAFESGDIYTKSDVTGLVLGAGNDAKIKYDGTDLEIDSSLVAPSDVTVQCGTNKTIELQEVVWDDLRVPLSSTKRLGFSDPDWVQFQDDGSGSVGVYGLAFSNVTDEEVFFTVQMSHKYKQGTDIHPHVHWAPSDADSGGVTWGLEYTWVNIGGTFGNTVIITSDDVTDTTALKHHYSDFPDITGTSKNISSILMCRLFRDISDANDTYAHDAFLLEIDFHFEIDTIGSRQELVK